MKKYLNDLAKRRDLLLYLVISGLKAQHRNTFLGYVWWLLDPLLGIAIYFLIVAVIFKHGGSDYIAYLTIGMMVWRWLGSTISGASRSIVSQAGIITQVYLPKAIFPLSAALSQTINFGFGLIVIGIFLGLTGFSVHLEIVWLPGIMACQLIFQCAVALVLGYICSFIQDIDTLVNHLSRLWFYLTPIIWKEELIGPHTRWLLDLNPMTHFLRAYRDIFMKGAAPDFFPLISIAAASGLVALGIIYFYSEYEHKIIKVL